MRYDDDRFIDLEDVRRGRRPRPRRSLSSGAIYHLSVRTSSRAKGHSARAAAAYIQRAAEYGREQGAELVYTESGHMPSWAEAEPTAYWDAADLYERANGRLCKKLEFALPLALSAAERRELAVGFAHHLTDGERLPYTLALHAGAGRNPHCHLMISERGNDGVERSPEQWFKRYNAAEPERGGARKSTALRPKAWLEETRAVWAEQTNQALELAGHAVRIDHRSLEAQGIERLPSVKLGPAALAMEAREIESARGDAAWRQAQGNAALADLNAALADLEVERQELKSQQEEVEHERRRPREQELERGDSHPPRGRGGPAPGHRGSRVPSLEPGPATGRRAEAERGSADPEQPSPILPTGGGEARGPQAGVASGAAAPADVPGVGPGGMDVAGGDLAGGRGHGGGRSQSADRVADVAEQAAVARWEDLLTDAAAEAREQEAQARAEARREREREQQRARARDQDKDLEWEP